MEHLLSTPPDFVLALLSLVLVAGIAAVGIRSNPPCTGRAEMSDILNFAFSEAHAMQATPIERCRSIAVEIEHLAATAISDAHSRCIELARELQAVADDLERASASNGDAM